LRQRGHDAVVVDPEAFALEARESRCWTAGVDVVVARGRSWAVLTMLGWAEDHGIPIVNSRRAVSSVHNKVDMALRLAEANLPVPPTWFGSPVQLAARLRPADYPCILKPVFGDNGAGLRLVNDGAELVEACPEPVALAQHFVPNSGLDLKLYCIGRDVWGVRKPSPWHHGPAEQVPLLPEWRDLAWRCGSLFGLELFGVDCVETAAGLVIIEVNEFPNYSAIPRASDMLVEYVVARAQQESAS
jgi:ribosomal protein S6--L-glutamate ligase